MKIGIIGSGNIGTTLAHLFAKAGHQVEISNSRGPASLEALCMSIGSNNVSAATPGEAVEFAEVILLAIPWRKRHELPQSDLFNGKIVIDAMNPYSENFEVIDLGNSTSSEEVQKQLSNARLVKAFNTMYYEMLRTGSLRDGGRKQQPGSSIYNNPMTVHVAYHRLAELDKHDDSWPHKD